MRFTTMIPAFTALAFAFPAAEPDADPQTASLDAPLQKTIPEWATIENVTFAGTGCPAGTVIPNFDGDYNVITLSFSAYQVEYKKGGVSSFADKNKNCNINFMINYPDGYSVTVAESIIRGYSYMTQGCTGTIKGTSWWAGDKKDAKCTETIRGPKKDDFKKVCKVDTNNRVWSACSAKRPLFNVNTVLDIDCQKTKKASDPEGLLRVQTQDTVIDTRYVWQFPIEWRWCK